MGFLRWAFSTPLAAIVTATLFILMAALVREPAVEWPEPVPYPDFEFVMEPEPEPTPPPPPRPTALPEPPPVNPNFPERSGPPDGLILDPPSLDPKLTPGDDRGLKLGAPVIKHAPLYPETCRTRQASGTVIVQFDVTPRGDVVNVRVIETAHRCFVRTVVATVSKWKYPPVAGEAMRYGLLESFSFQLVD